MSIPILFEDIAEEIVEEMRRFTMPRPILTEEQPKTEAVEQNNISEENKIIANNKDILAGETTIITAEEMRRACNEWNENGQNDFNINANLAERIRQYLEYREEIDPLMAKMAERIYKPYIVDVNREQSEIEAAILLNNTKIIPQTKLFKISGQTKGPQLISISDFKRLIIALKNPYGIYINVQEEIYIDVKSYIYMIGGNVNLKEDGGNYDWHYTMEITL